MFILYAKQINFSAFPPPVVVSDTLVFCIIHVYVSIGFNINTDILVSQIQDKFYSVKINGKLPHSVFEVWEFSSSV